MMFFKRKEMRAGTGVQRMPPPYLKSRDTNFTNSHEFGLQFPRRFVTIRGIRVSFRRINADSEQRAERRAG